MAQTARDPVVPRRGERLVDPDEVGETKFTGRGQMLGAPAPTTDMQQQTRPHDVYPNPPKGEQPIEAPPEPTQQHGHQRERPREAVLNPPVSPSHPQPSPQVEAQPRR